MPDFWITIIILGATIGVGVFRYKRLRPFYIQRLVILLVACFILQFVAYYYSQITNKTNHFIITIYFLIQVSSILLLYIVASPDHRQKRITKLLFVIYLLFAGWNISLGQGFFVFNSNSVGLGAVCIIISSILYLSKLFLSDNPINFFRIPMFWVATGWLFYFTGVIVYFSLLGYIVNNNLDPQGNIYAIIMLALEFILYVLIMIGFYTASKWNEEKPYLQ